MSMRLKLKRETLLEPLQKVAGVVERKPVAPILSNVLVEANGDQLSVTGTNQEVELLAKMPLEEPTTQPYRLALPALKLLNICKALPENLPITLHQKHERLVLEAGQSRFSLIGQSAADFPSMSHQEQSRSFSISQSALGHALHRTAFAMAQQDIRLYLNGMLFECSDHSLRMISADGHRLALSVLPVSTQNPCSATVLLPRKGVHELARILGKDTVDINIEISDRYFRLDSSQVRLTSKLISANYPDYEQIIPKTKDQAVLIDRDILRNALSRVAILSDENLRGVRLEIQGGVMRIQSNNLVQEHAEEVLQLDQNASDSEGASLDHPPITVAFNVHYLLDVLAVLSPGQLCLTFSGDQHVLLIEESDQHSHSLFVVMPIYL